MTLKHFGLIFLLSCIYIFIGIGVPAILALLVLTVIGASTALTFGVLLAIIIIGVAIFIPLLNEMVKRIVVLPTSALAVPLGELRMRLAALAHAESPLELTPQPNGYWLALRLSKAEQLAELRRVGISEAFKISIILDEDRARATLTEHTASLQWGRGPEGFELSWNWSRGASRSWSASWEWRGDTSTDQQTPVLLERTQRLESIDGARAALEELFHESGWTVRYAIF